MGRRALRRGADAAPTAPTTDHSGPDGMVLTLRGALTPATRARYADTLHGGLNREDARQRAIELLFEHLAVSWTIAGVVTDRPKELLGRYRMASGTERVFVRDALRAQLAESFPDVEAP